MRLDINSSEESSSDILQCLKAHLPSCNITNDPEDIYVYSHYGVFGTKLIRNVIAVIHPDPNLSSDTISKAENAASLSIIKRDNFEEISLSDETPIVIVDDYNGYDPEKLLDELKKLENSIKNDRMFLNQSKPLGLWILDKLKTNPNYSPNSKKLDLGYCVAETDSIFRQTSSSKGRLLLCRGLLNGELEVSDRLIDTMYRCSTCGQCYNDIYDEELRINKSIIEARHEIVKKCGDKTPLKSLVRNITSTGNPSGLSREDRTLWYEDIAESHAFNHNEILYWTGCTTSYRIPEIVKSTVKVFEKANLDFGMLGNNETCCGLTLYLAGYFEEAQKNARAIVARVKEIGVRHIVTSCAGCYYAFSKVYKELGIDTGFKVDHTTQLFERLIDDCIIKPLELHGRYTWHDPCDLGRHSGVYQAPRNILKSIPGLEVIESPLTGRHARCCGGGGALMAYDYDLSKSIAESKLKLDIHPLRVEGVITGCPACILNLRGVKEESLRILDISQILSKSI